MKVAAVFFFLILSACAKPVYVAAPPPAAGEEQKGVSNAKATCDLRFEKAQLCLSWSWQKLPDDRSAGAMQVKIWRPNLADGSPVLMAVPGLGAYLKMANMPHGSAPVRITTEDVGTFLISNVYFSMHGPWYIYVQLKDASGNESDRLQIDYRF